jgi:uncharacterized membrane protein
MGRGRQGRTNWPLLLTVGIAVALALRVWSVWAQLPDTMASHFGPTGRPDSFMSKDAFFLFMALIGGGSVASVFASPILIRHLPPSLVNLPNRHYWLANEERREVAIDRVRGLLGWVGMATALLVAMVIELAMQANLHRSNLDNGAFMTVLVAYFAFVIAVFIRKMRLLKLPE